MEGYLLKDQRTDSGFIEIFSGLVKDSGVSPVLSEFYTAGSRPTLLFLILLNGCLLEYYCTMVLRIILIAGIKLSIDPD